MINAIASGVLMSKTTEIVYALLEELAFNNCQWTSERAGLKPAAEMLEFDKMSSIAS